MIKDFLIQIFEEVNVDPEITEKLSKTYIYFRELQH